MLASLEGHRFSRVIRQTDEGGYLYEFTPAKADGPVILAAWHPTKEATGKLETGGRKILKAEMMPMDNAGAKPVVIREGEGGPEVTVDIDPILIWLAP